jgi:hypothetical protein
LLEQRVQRFGTVEIGERDRHDAQRVFAELALRARERIAVAQLAVAHQQAVEHLEERSNPFLATTLLEQRPAVLVQALLVEIAVGTGLDDRGVCGLGVAIAAGAEQDLAAAELRLRVPRALRELPDQLVEHRERLLRLALRFVRTRQLIHHRIVARVIGVRRQQALIEPDRLLQLQTFDARIHAAGPRGFVDLHLQVAEASHCLGAHLLVARLQLQELAVLLDRLLRLHVARRIGRDLDFAVLEVLDRARGLLLGGRYGDRAECTDADERGSQDVA